MATTITLIWHRLWNNAPADRRAMAPWKLTGLDGSPVYARVQHQDGSWQGQVIVNSIPADWRKSHKGTGFPNSWHPKQADAFASVEKFLGSHAQSLFGVADLTILTWDDTDLEEKPKSEPPRITGEKSRVMIVGDSMIEPFDTPLTDKLKSDLLRAEMAKVEQRMIEDLTKRAPFAPKSYQKDFMEWTKRSLSADDLVQLKKYWG